VPIETGENRLRRFFYTVVAFTPKGGCPLKLDESEIACVGACVAFTPKGGCPLKH